MQEISTKHVAMAVISIEIEAQFRLKSRIISCVSSLGIYCLLFFPLKILILFKLEFLFFFQLESISVGLERLFISYLIWFYYCLGVIKNFPENKH